MSNEERRLSAFLARTTAWTRSPLAERAGMIAKAIHDAYGTSGPLIDSLRLEVPVSGDIGIDCEHAVAAWIVRVMEDVP